MAELTLTPIVNRDEYDKCIKRIHALWGALPFTPEYEELDLLVIRAEEYEAACFDIRDQL